MTTAREAQVLRRSIAATLLVSALGIGFGLVSGAQSIIFDGVFSVLDAALSLLSLMVTRLVVREDSRRFQHGFWHIEPMVIAVNGGITLLLCGYAFVTAATDLLAGGRPLAFGWAAGYAVVVAAMGFAMFAYGRRANRQIGSDLLALDARGWLLSALITSALLVAFVAGAILDGTPYAWLTPYVDPAVLMVLTLCLLPVPARIVWRAATEIFLITPDTLDARVRRVMDEVVARHGFTTYSSYAAKVGRGRFIEIHVVVPSDHPGTTAWFDEIRREIGDALGGAGPHRWLTIVFTTDPAWI